MSDVTAWAEEWQRSWDRLEDRYVPERERQIAALLDVVEAVGGSSPTVLDLACGTGTVTRRLLDRLPMARSIAVDVDPALLEIAAATFAADDRVTLARCDLRDETWLDAVGESSIDVVVTSTALHWLREDTVRRLYRQLGGVLRSGGALAHAERMPLEGVPRLAAALATIERERAARRRGDGPDWDTWWAQVATDPALSAASRQRRALFGGNYPTEEFSPPAEWHVAAMLDAGFAEAGVVWRAGQAAVVAALR